MGSQDGRKIVARNRKARHEYEVLDTYEAGLVLEGPEVKSVREGKVAFRDAFARIDGGEVWIHNLHISPYAPADRMNRDPTRTRKLLLRKSQIESLFGEVRQKGRTLIPLDLYFRQGYAKVTLALARGRQLHDKREKLKRETMEREAEQAMDRYR